MDNKIIKQIVDESNNTTTYDIGVKWDNIELPNGSSLSSVHQLPTNLIATDNSHQFMTQEDKDKISIINGDNQISASNVQETESKKFMTQEDKDKISIINNDKKISASNVQETESKKFMTQEDKDKISAINKNNQIPANKIETSSTQQFVSQAEKDKWDGKQGKINKDNKLSANLIDQTDDLKFVTSDEKGQIAEASRAIQEDFYTKEQTYDRKTIDSNYELKTDKINDLIKSVSNVDESKKSPTTTAIKEYIRYNNAREYLNWTNNKYLSYDNTTTNGTSLIRDSGKTYTYVSDAIYLAQNDKIYIQTYLGKNHFNNLTNPCSVIIKTTNDVNKNDDVVKHWLIDNNSGYKTYTFDNIKSEDSSNSVIGNQGLYVYVCASQTLDPAIKPQNNLDITIQILNDSDKIKKIYNASIIKANRVAQDDKNYQFVTEKEKNKWNSILDDNGKIAKNISVDLIETNQQKQFVSPEQIDIWSNKQAAINEDNKITSNLIDDESQEQKFVTEEEKDKWNEATDGLLINPGGEQSFSKSGADFFNSSKSEFVFSRNGGVETSTTDTNATIYYYDFSSIIDQQSITKFNITITTSVSSWKNVPYVLKNTIENTEETQRIDIGELKQGEITIPLGDILSKIRQGYPILAIMGYNTTPTVSITITKSIPPQYFTKEQYETDKQELQNNINEKIQKPNSIIPDVYSYDDENGDWNKENIAKTSIDFDLSNDIEPKFEDFTFEENDQILGLDSLTSQRMIRGIKKESEGEGYTITDNYYIVSENNNNKIKNVLKNTTNNNYIIDKKCYNKNNNNYTIIENVDIIDDETYNNNIANGNYIVYNKYYIETNNEDSNNDKINDIEDQSIIKDKIFFNKPKLFSHCYLNAYNDSKRKIILGGSDEYRKAYILIAPVQSEDIIKIYGQSDKNRHQWFFINKDSSTLTPSGNEIECSSIIIPSSNNEIISENKRKEFIYTIKVPNGASHIVINGYVYLPRIYKMAGFQKKRPWGGKKWCVIGDSLTEKNAMTFKNYADYISDATGIEVINLGLSGSGYKRKFDDKTSNNAFFGNRLENFEGDVDVITIMGGVNDAIIRASYQSIDLSEICNNDGTFKAGSVECIEPNIIYKIGNKYYTLTQQMWQEINPSDPTQATEIEDNKKLIFNGDIYRDDSDTSFYIQCQRNDNGEWSYSQIAENSLLYDELINNNTTLFVGDILDNLTDDESYKIDNMSLMGCVNRLINKLEKVRPDIQIGIMSSIPTNGYNRASVNAVKFVNALEQLCKYRNIPFLNLFYSSNLRAWEKNRDLYSRDTDPEGNLSPGNIHPNERAHKLVAPKIKNFLNNFIL